MRSKISLGILYLKEKNPGIIYQIDCASGELKRIKKNYFEV